MFMHTQPCITCTRVFPLEGFPQRDGRPRPQCRECFNAARRTSRVKGKWELVNAQTRLATDVMDLFELAKKGPITLEELCNKLEISPKQGRALVEKAKSQGLQVLLQHDHIGLQLEHKDERVQTVVAPTVGQRQKIGVISDTHLGSKYCLRAQLKEFVHHAYDQGVREILHPGDILDGDYRHGKFEMSHMGVEDQTTDLIQTLPKLPGLTYHGISGNHDFTFTEASGLNVTHYIQQRFREAGRNDFFGYGDRSAFLKVRGAVIHLWHPKSGTGYARSYAIQKEIERYSSLKPQILLIGHWHVFCHVYERNVHGVACPTFQGGGSAFGKSLGGAPAIGGLVLSWDLTAENTMRSFTVETRNYVERETIYNPHNIIDAYEV